MRPNYETLDSYGTGQPWETASHGRNRYEILQRRQAEAIDAQIRAEHPELFGDGDQALQLRRRQLELERLRG